MTPVSVATRTHHAGSLLLNGGVERHDSVQTDGIRETRDLGVGVFLSVEPGSEQFFGRLAVIYDYTHGPRLGLSVRKLVNPFSWNGALLEHNR
jgi:hypothetical protein